MATLTRFAATLPLPLPLSPNPNPAPNPDPDPNPSAYLYPKPNPKQVWALAALPCSLLASASDDCTVRLYW